MKEYAYAANQIQESLVEAYLKKNPGIRREDVIIKTVNGKLVYSTIVDFFMAMANSASESKIQISPEELEPLNQDEKSRVASCIKSLKTCARLIDVLLKNHASGFAMEKGKHNQFLKRQKGIFLNSVKASYESKQDILAMINIKGAFKRNLLRNYLTEFLQAVVDQLKSLCLIYKREYELSQRLSNHTKNMIDTHLKDIEGSMSREDKEKVARVYIYLMKDPKIDLPPVNKLNISMMSKAIDKLGIKLENFRQEISKIENVISFVEELVENLKRQSEEEERPRSEPVHDTSPAPAPYSDPQFKKTKKDDKKKPTHRMAVMSRFEKRR